VYGAEYKGREGRGNIQSLSAMKARLKKSEISQGRKEVLFEFYAPVASEVYLAGTFNDWSPRSTPMLRQSDGRWSCRLMLLPGEYEYLFFVDGQWLASPAATELVANPFGGCNCVVRVG